MIPYVDPPALQVGAYTLTAFRALVIAAVAVQYLVVVRRAPRMGIDRDAAASLIIWAIGLGLVSAHVFDVLAYDPERLRQGPWELLRFWGGLSSTGGMAGGLAGLLLVARRKGLGTRDLVRFVDVVMFALPFCLATGRLGCALQHDHPGIASSHPLAVAFPDGSRFDLGLLEFLAVGALCAAFLALDRRPRAPGFWLGAFFASYGPIRFALDALRTGDARYAGLTPAQYLMLGAALLGLGVLYRVRGRAQAA